MKRLLLALIMGAFVATPAMADFFTFSYNPLETWYNTATNIFTADEIDAVFGGTIGDVTRGDIPQQAQFQSPWVTEDFALQMAISNINATGTTADGAGSVTLLDVDGDTIQGNFAGSWTTVNRALIFSGSMSEVVYLPTGAGGNIFTGDIGFMSTVFPVPAPWTGVLIELNQTGLSFLNSWGDGTPADEIGGARGAGVEAAVVPVPAALLLGALGLGAAGVKLRRFV